MVVLQSDLKGNAIRSKDPDKPWSGFCCEACWNATGKRCRCRCGGAFHGIGHGNHRANGRPTMTRQRHLEHMKHYDSSPAAQKYREQVKDETCRWCGGSLKGSPILHYPHDGGWPVEGYEKYQWLFIVCPGCGYQWALWKLGVPR